MTGSSSEIRLKYGKDASLEKEANKWLAASVGDNKRSIARDAEKMKFERGFIGRGELQHYDPDNDWTTADSAFSVVVDPGDVDSVDPTICAEADDGNIRARNPTLLERQALMRHVEDSDYWGSTREEEIPALGLNGGARKTCVKCQRSKRVELFYAHPKTKDGFQSWCKSCQKS